MRQALLVLALVLAAKAAHAGAIIDGDTMELESERVRLHGIDAFERAQQCWTAGGRQWACGGAAKRALEDLIAGAWAGEFVEPWKWRGR